MFRFRKTLAVITISICAIAVTITSFEFSNAAPAKCIPVKPNGKTIGRINVSDISLPIKNFIYPEGGKMEPQGSTLMAAVSLRHMPLSSTIGSSVIVWHRDYKGCSNELNIFLKRQVGSTFTIKDENNEIKTYKVSKKLVVDKGGYKASWFRTIGPRQLVLVTCTGPFRNGHYEQNFVLIAEPK